MWLTDAHCHLRLQIFCRFDVGLFVCLAHLQLVEEPVFVYVSFLLFRAIDASDVLAGSLSVSLFLQHPFLYKGLVFGACPFCCITASWIPFQPPSSLSPGATPKKRKQHRRKPARRSWGLPILLYHILGRPFWDAHFGTPIPGFVQNRPPSLARPLARSLEDPMFGLLNPDDYEKGLEEAWERAKPAGSTVTVKEMTRVDSPPSRLRARVCVFWVLFL